MLNEYQRSVQYQGLTGAAADAAGGEAAVAGAGAGVDGDAGAGLAAGALVLPKGNFTVVS